MSDLTVYDVEATDVDVRHGQITQFAALRADENFNVVGETEVRIRRLPYVVPAPEALAVTGMDPFDLDDDALPTEFEAARVMEDALRPRIGRAQTNLTYNGLRYDDEMIRTALFRNLRSPWFSSAKNITRVDLLSVIRLVHAGDPDAIAIPAGEDGSRSWRLEAVCRANGIEIKAHDAMGDVRATLALGRAVARQAPWAWAEALSCGRAAVVESLLADCHRRGAVAWLFTHYGTPDLVPCAVLGTDDRKKWILADLRRDDLTDDPARISERLYSKDSPFRVIRSNASPLLVSDLSVPRLRTDANIDAFLRLSSDIKEKERIGPAAREALLGSKYEVPADPTSEERIYDGFIPDSERPRMGAFLNARTWAERAAVRFGDPRLRDFAARIVVEAVSTGRATDVPAGVAEEAAYNCADAYERPHAGADARWTTLAGARAKGADGRWEEWASRTFAGSDMESVVSRAVRPGEGMTAQAGFGF